MSRLTAQEIMTREVIAILARACLVDVTDTLTAHHISGAPVVDAGGYVMGVLSEGDLIGRGAGGASSGAEAFAEEILERSYRGSIVAAPAAREQQAAGSIPA